MKFEIGDIVSLKEGLQYDKYYGGACFVEGMYLPTVTIRRVDINPLECGYTVAENDFLYTDEMLSEKVGTKTEPKPATRFVVFRDAAGGAKTYVLRDGEYVWEHIFSPDELNTPHNFVTLISWAVELLREHDKHRDYKVACYNRGSSGRWQNGTVYTVQRGKVKDKDGNFRAVVETGNNIVHCDGAEFVKMVNYGDE